MSECMQCNGTVIDTQGLPIKWQGPIRLHRVPGPQF